MAWSRYSDAGIWVRLVAAVFFMEGLLAAMGMVFRIHPSYGPFDFTVLLIPACYGLRRFSRGWRTFALIDLWISMTGCLSAAIPAVTIHTPGDRFILFGIALVDNSRGLHVAASVAFILAVWQYRVLTRPAIRALFAAQVAF